MIAGLRPHLAPRRARDLASRRTREHHPPRADSQLERGPPHAHAAHHGHHQPDPDDEREHRGHGHLSGRSSLEQIVEPRQRERQIDRHGQRHRRQPRRDQAEHPGGGPGAAEQLDHHLVALASARHLERPDEAIEVCRRELKIDRSHRRAVDTKACSRVAVSADTDLAAVALQVRDHADRGVEARHHLSADRDPQAAAMDWPRPPGHRHRVVVNCQRRRTRHHRCDDQADKYGHSRETYPRHIRRGAVLEQGYQHRAARRRDQEHRKRRDPEGGSRGSLAVEAERGHGAQRVTSVGARKLV